MRTVRLSENLTRDIFHMCNHYIDNTDGTLTQDYEEIRDMCTHDKRFRMVVALEEKIPECSDLIVNVVVKHILDIVDCNEDPEEYMTALLEYLEEVHGMNIVDYQAMVKLQPVEALEYGVKWLITEMGGDV